MLSEVRKAYGISQNHLALCLGITRSHLSMAEIGKRDLPTSAVITLGELYKAIEESARIKDTENKLPVHQKERFITLVSTKLKQNQYKLESAKRLLNKMRQDHLNAASVLDHLKILIAAAEHPRKTVVELAELATKKILAKTGEDSQFLLELRIHALQAKITFLEEKNLSLETNPPESRDSLSLTSSQAVHNQAFTTILVP